MKNKKAVIITAAIFAALLVLALVCLLTQITKPKSPPADNSALSQTVSSHTVKESSGQPKTDSGEEIKPDNSNELEIDSTPATVKTASQTDTKTDYENIISQLAGTATGSEAELEIDINR